MHSTSNINNILLKLSPEAELLLFCISPFDALKDPIKLQAITKQNINWNYLLNIANANKVLPLLYFQITANCPELIPTTYLNTLKNYCLKNSKKNLFLSQETLKLLALFKTNNISAIPIKGPVMTSYLYQNLSLREFNDLDFLVQETDLSLIKKLLTSQGYIPEIALTEIQEEAFIKYHYQLVFKNKNGLEIDIHWRIAPKYFNNNFKFNDLWKELQETECGGEEIKSLSPENLLLILCINGTKDLWNELKTIVDITQLIKNKEINWKKTIHKSQLLGMEKSLLIGTSLASTLLKIELPALISKKIKSNSQIIKLTKEICLKLLDIRKPIGMKEECCFQLKALDSFRHKVKYCFKLIMTPTLGDWQFISFPRHLSLLYYVTRPIRLAKKYLLGRFKPKQYFHSNKNIIVKS